jgi:hypothetical protein
MGTEFQEVLCDELRLRARHDRRCARVASRRALPSGKPREPYARPKWSKGYYRRADTNSSDPPTTKVPSTNSSHPPPPPCGVAAFVVNTGTHTGARPSVRLCVGPELLAVLIIIFFFSCSCRARCPAQDGAAETLRWCAGAGCVKGGAVSNQHCSNLLSNERHRISLRAKKNNIYAI